MPSRQARDDTRADLDVHAFFHASDQPCRKPRPQRNGSNRMQTTMAQQKDTNSLQRTRVLTERVRTGCVTCKRRHVKCDEQRPHCVRCQKAGYVCEGYVAPLSRRAAVAASISIHPKSNPRTLLALDASEYQGFTYFYKNTASTLNIGFEYPFWDGHILQLSQTEPAVRHALTALGALHAEFTTSLATTSLGPLQVTGIRPDTKQFHSCALRHYSKAIRHLQPILASKTDHHVRVALICCLLFVLMESMMGGHITAMVHLRSGLDIVNTVRQQPISASSPETALVDAVLLRLFANLEFQAASASYGRLEGKLSQHRRPQLGTEAQIPAAFSNMANASTSLEELLSSIYDLCDLLMNTTQSTPSNRLASDPSFSERHGLLVAHLEKWSNAFRAFLTSTNLTTKGLQTAVLLKLNEKLGRVMLAACSPTPSTFDDVGVIDDYNTIIKLARSFKSGSAINQPTLSIYTGMVPALFFTSVACPDRNIRMSATELLTTTPRREGIWDGAMAAVVARYLAESEDGTEDDNNSVQEGTMVRLRKIRVQMMASKKSEHGFASAVEA